MTCPSPARYGCWTEASLHRPWPAAAFLGGEAPAWPGLFSQDPHGLGDGKLADPGSGGGRDGVGQGGRCGGDANLTDPRRRLARLDQQDVDLWHRLHPHDRVTVEVLGDDLAAVAEHGLTPGGGAQRPDEAAFDLRADQVRV